MTDTDSVTATEEITVFVHVTKKTGGHGTGGTPWSGFDLPRFAAVSEGIAVVDRRVTTSGRETPWAARST
jgi:hypothetical protein